MGVLSHVYGSASQHRLSSCRQVEPRVGTTLPLVALREQLAEARSRGESFGECWPAIVKGVLDSVDAKARVEWRWA
jgi:hypothetical protein